MPKLLLDLPPELTEIICAFAVTEPYGVAIKEETGEVGAAILSSDKQPGITRVNKRLRRESLHHFYRNNEFILDLHGRDEFKQPQLDLARNWMSRLGGRNASHLRRLAFRGRMEFENAARSGWLCSNLLAYIDFTGGKMSVIWLQPEGIPANAFEEARSLEVAFDEGMRKRKGLRLDYGCLGRLLEAFQALCAGTGYPMPFEAESFDYARRDIVEACKLVEDPGDVANVDVSAD